MLHTFLESASIEQESRCWASISIDDGCHIISDRKYSLKVTLLVRLLSREESQTRRVRYK